MIDDTIKKDTEVKDEVKETEEVVDEKVVEPEVKTTPIKEPEVEDVDLGFVEKKRFRIAGDYNRMLELNVSDLNITTRLSTGYPKLKALLKEAQEKITSLPDEEDDEKALAELSARLTDIDNKMREIIDYVFDTNASEVCAPSGNMFDPVGGQYRFERIIDTLVTLYTTGLDKEFQQIKNRVETKTNKYTKKYHK